MSDKDPLSLAHSQLDIFMLEPPDSWHLEVDEDHGLSEDDIDALYVYHRDQIIQMLSETNGYTTCRAIEDSLPNRVEQLQSIYRKYTRDLYNLDLLSASLSIEAERYGALTTMGALVELTEDETNPNFEVGRKHILEVESGLVVYRTIDNVFWIGDEGGPFEFEMTIQDVLEKVNDTISLHEQMSSRASYSIDFALWRQDLLRQMLWVIETGRDFKTVKISRARSKLMRRGGPIERERAIQAYAYLKTYEEQGNNISDLSIGGVEQEIKHVYKIHVSKPLANVSYRLFGDAQTSSVPALFYELGLFVRNELEKYENKLLNGYLTEAQTHFQ